MRIDQNRDDISGVDRWPEALEPSGGWPPKPWDHRVVTRPDGAEAWVAFTPDGTPVVDADGHAVRIADRKPARTAWEPAPPAGEVDLSALGDDATACLQEAALVARDYGRPWVGREHLLVAILRHRPDIAAQLADVLDPDKLEKLISTSSDRDDAEARSILVQARRAGKASRPPPESVRWTESLSRLVEAAWELAHLSGDPEPGAEHLLVLELASEGFGFRFSSIPRFVEVNRDRRVRANAAEARAPLRADRRVAPGPLVDGAGPRRDTGRLWRQVTRHPVGSRQAHICRPRPRSRGNARRAGGPNPRPRMHPGASRMA